MRAVIYTGAGGNEVLSVGERPEPVPGADQVLVAVRHAGINPAALHQRQGHYPAPPGAPADIPGLEVAGTVVAIGAGVLDWAVGDRVLGLIGGGGFAERVAVHGRHVARVPAAIDDVAAAAIPEVFITAHDAIRTRGGLTPGGTLLVRGANGGVGLAALQIAATMGARALGAVRSEAAAAAVTAHGGEPILVGGDDDLAAAVLERTDGRGADVAVELVGGPGVARTLASLAPRGRLVVVGTGAGAKVELNLGELMRRRAELHGTVLRARSIEDKALAVRAFEREVLPLLADGRLRATVEAIVPVDRVGDAYDLLEAGGRTGKILVGL